MWDVNISLPYVLLQFAFVRIYPYSPGFRNVRMDTDVTARV